MDILGAIGQLYTFVLLVLLILGSGLAVWAVGNSINKNKDKIAETVTIGLNKIKNNKIIGGFLMKSKNGFIKLAVFSFVGIIISAAILAAVSNTGNSMNNMNMQSSMNGMYAQTNMNGQSMQGMSGSYMNSQYPDLNSIQQQLYDMQQQINQMQSQMNYPMYGMQSQGMYNSSMSNNNMNNNMNNSSMNNNSMNNSSMNNSNMNNSNMNSSSGSMGMM